MGVTIKKNKNNSIFQTKYKYKIITGNNFLILQESYGSCSQQLSFWMNFQVDKS